MIRYYINALYNIILHTIDALHDTISYTLHNRCPHYSPDKAIGALIPWGNAAPRAPPPSPPPVPAPPPSPPTTTPPPPAQVSSLSLSVSRFLLYLRISPFSLCLSLVSLSRSLLSASLSQTQTAFLDCCSVELVQGRLLLMSVSVSVSILI